MTDKRYPDDGGLGPQKRAYEDTFSAADTFKPMRLIGFDVDTRVMVEWPFIKIRFGKVWRVGRGIRHSIFGR